MEVCPLATSTNSHYQYSACYAHDALRSVFTFPLKILLALLAREATVGEGEGGSEGIDVNVYFSSTAFTTYDSSPTVCKDWSSFQYENFD